MAAVSRSVLAFGVYLVAIGAVVLLIPNVLLAALGVPLTGEPWIRLAGILLIALGVYYLVCARAGEHALMRASVPVRCFAAGGLVVLALVWGYWPVLAFAAIDAGGAAWTWWTLRRAAAMTQR